jgi:hypothetical protein
MLEMEADRLRRRLSRHLDVASRQGHPLLEPSRANSTSIRSRGRMSASSARCPTNGPRVTRTRSPGRGDAGRGSRTKPATSQPDNSRRCCGLSELVASFRGARRGLLAAAGAPRLFQETFETHKRSANSPDILRICTSLHCISNTSAVVMAVRFARRRAAYIRFTPRQVGAIGC